MSEAQLSPPSQALISENAAILERFRRDGVDIECKLEFDFIVEFASKSQAEDFRAAIRKLIPSVKSAYGLNECVFMLCRYEDEGLFELRTCVEMSADARVISGLEAVLNSVAPKFGGSECCWEFPDPANKDVVTHSGRRAVQ
ncbi:MAG: ribonuclease E inhibitor RraB [Ruegeria sp.]